MDILDMVAGGQRNRGGAFIAHGRYKLLLESFKKQETDRSSSLVAVFRVLEAKALDSAEPSSVGSKVNYIQNFTKRPEISTRNMKDLVLELLGLPDNTTKEATAAALNKLISEPQPCRGLRIDCETYRYTSKENKTDR